MKKLQPDKLTPLQYVTVSILWAGGIFLAIVLWKIVLMFISFIIIGGLIDACKEPTIREQILRDRAKGEHLYADYVHPYDRKMRNINNI